jgi:hypothetical protein
MAPEEAYAALVEAMQELRNTSDEIGTLNSATRAADAWDALDGWLTRGGFLPAPWRKWREEAKASDERASVVSVEPVVSLGEQPHDPRNCFMHHGRPHLGPCMDAEAFTRWFWLEGPGSQPVSSTHIAIATQQLVREAYEARAERLERQRLAANERFRPPAEVQAMLDQQEWERGGALKRAAEHFLGPEPNDGEHGA